MDKQTVMSQEDLNRIIAYGGQIPEEAIAALEELMGTACLGGNLGTERNVKALIAEVRRLEALQWPPNKRNAELAAENECLKTQLIAYEKPVKPAMMRFDCCTGDGGGEMWSDIEGDYVLYADHAAEVKRLRDALTVIKAKAVREYEAAGGDNKWGCVDDIADAALTPPPTGDRATV